MSFLDGNVQLYAGNQNDLEKTDTTQADHPTLVSHLKKDIVSFPSLTLHTEEKPQVSPSHYMALHLQWFQDHHLHTNSALIMVKKLLCSTNWHLQAVGTFSALAGPSLTTNETPDLSYIISRIPLVFVWNWLNLLVFNIANQRLPDSVLEDQINKPWRPMPSNRLSSDEARQLLLTVLPCSLILMYFIGAFEDALWMVALTWMYNDLGGADVSIRLDLFATQCH